MSGGKRNELIDFTKGLLILGVIWGHSIAALSYGCSSPVWILTFLRIYDMPFFMIIAGYLLNRSSKKRDTLDLLFSKVGGIFIPLILWEILIGVFGPLFESLKNIFSLWYLWSYLGCAFIMIIVNHLFSQYKLRIIVNVLVVLALHLMPFQPPFNMGYMYPYLCIGFFLPDIAVEKRVKKNTLDLILLHLFIVFTLCLCFWKSSYQVWNVDSSFILAEPGQIPIILFRFFIGVVGCICMWYFFKMLHDTIPAPIAGFFSKAGQNSMMIYIIQSIIVERLLSKGIQYMTASVGDNPLVSNMKLLGYFIAPATAILTIALSLLVIGGIRKIPYVGKALTGVRISTDIFRKKNRME